MKSQRSQFVSTIVVLAAILAAGLLFEFGTVLALPGAVVVAGTAFGVVRQSRARTLRRLHAALDRYAEREMGRARLRKIAQHAV